MKRLFVMAVSAVVSLALAGGVWAAPKPPRTVCLQWMGLEVSVLVIKSFGKVTTSAGRTKIYALYGERIGADASSRALSGTGHMNGNIFHFGFTAGGLGTLPNLVAYTYEGFFDVTTGAGSGEASRYGGGDPGQQSPPLAITVVSCPGSLPYGNGDPGDSPGLVPWESEARE